MAMADSIAKVVGNGLQPTFKNAGETHPGRLLPLAAVVHCHYFGFQLSDLIIVGNGVA
jgi:hypothetical protein